MSVKVTVTTELKKPPKVTVDFTRML